MVLGCRALPNEHRTRVRIGSQSISIPDSSLTESRRDWGRTVGCADYFIYFHVALSVLIYLPGIPPSMAVITFHFRRIWIEQNKIMLAKNMTLLEESPIR